MMHKHTKYDTCTHVRMHVNTDIHTRAHTYVHTQACTLACTHTHACMKARTHTFTHTHAHTHTHQAVQGLSLSPVPGSMDHSASGMDSKRSSMHKQSRLGLDSKQSSMNKGSATERGSMKSSVGWGGLGLGSQHWLDDLENSQRLATQLEAQQVQMVNLEARLEVGCCVRVCVCVCVCAAVEKFGQQDLAQLNCRSFLCLFTCITNQDCKQRSWNEKLTSKKARLLIIHL